MTRVDADDGTTFTGMTASFPLVQAFTILSPMKFPLQHIILGEPNGVRVLKNRPGSEKVA